jgi:hypothetical protein
MVVVLVFGLSSCASTREKPLPVEGARAELWLAPLASCAEERAFETRKLDRRTQVRVDEYTTVDYVLARAGLEQQVAVTTDTDTAGHFAEGEHIAEDVYTCAERQMQGGSSNADRAQVSPCQRVAVCNAAIVRELCAGDGTSCPYLLRAADGRRLRGRRACSGALERLTTVVVRLRSQQPHVTLPAECGVEPLL